MRAPTMPNGTAHTATSSEAHGATPRARSRYSMIRQAATMPSTMHSAYARTGRPSRCQTDVVGLGVAARFMGVTGAHATADGPARNAQGCLLLRRANALGEFRAQRPQPGQPGRLV